MPLPKIVEKLIPGAQSRYASFSPPGEPMGAQAPSPTAPDATEEALPAPRRPSLFEIVLQAYVSAPGGD